MKYCQKCGKEIMEQAVVCPSCGCAVNGNALTEQSSEKSNETSGFARAALGLAFIIPIVGLILGIIGCFKYKTPEYKKKCIVAIPVSIVAWIIWSAIMFF